MGDMKVTVTCTLDLSSEQDCLLVLMEWQDLCISEMKYVDLSGI